jgi:uracil-DNA glycosylase
MSSLAIVEWLKEVGDDLLTASCPSHLINQPVQTLKRAKSIPVKASETKHSTVNANGELVKGAKSLAELRHLMEKFDACDLKKMANKMVFGDGNPESKIMLIGEAPGADEDREGLPFVGASGKLLDQMLACIGLTRANYYITNIIPWRPPGNRNPTQEEIEMCMPFVERHIELIQPKVIVMIGGVAAKSILNVTTGITGIRGHWHGYKTTSMTDTLQAYAIYHPSYLLRSPGQKRIAWHDLLVLKQKLQELGLI